MEQHNRVFFAVCFFLCFLLTGYKGVQGSSHHHHHHHRHRHNLHSKHQEHEFRPTKLFVFGDSYADTGNDRKPVANSWKEPYGITFPGKPTGRFSDGRVLTDFIAKFLGLKTPIAYKWRKVGAKKLHYGMNFAYGGTGVFDTLVPEPNMTTQIGFLQNLLHCSVYNISDLHSSVALVTLSGNDYSAYLAKGGSLQGLQTFIPLVVQQLAVNLKRIHGMGIQKIAATGLQPLGCLPRSTAASSFQQCNSTENLLVSLHNQLLQQAVATLNNETKDSTIVLIDLYDSFMTVLKNKGDRLGSSKFENPLKPCCMGTSSSYSCGSVDKNGTKEYTVCDDPKSAFFWDTAHPTQEGWQAVCTYLQANLKQL